MDYNDLIRAFDTLDPADWERLGRYLEGRSTPTEAEMVENWIAADPRRSELIAEIRRAHAISEVAPEIWGTQAAWKRLVSQIAKRDPQIVSYSTTSGIERATVARSSVGRCEALAHRGSWWRGRTRQIVQFAAVFVLLLGGSLLWQNRAELIPTPEVPMREVAAGIGERKRLILVDGSEIVLGPSSRISFPERFGSMREITLEGEAVFDVVRNDAEFVVRAGSAVTRVLGTRFGVSAYPDDSFVEVVVAEGRVEVSLSSIKDTAEPIPGTSGSSHQARTELTSGMAVRVDGSALSAPRVINSDHVLAWAEGKLVFDGESLGDVVRILQRRYGIQIDIEDPSLAEVQLTAEFEQLSKEDIVELIALSLGLEARRTATGGFLLSSF